MFHFTSNIICLTHVQGFEVESSSSCLRWFICQGWLWISSSRQLMSLFMLCSRILPATGLTYVCTTPSFWGSCSRVVASRLWLTAVFSSQHCQFWEGSCWFAERFSLAQLFSSEIHESSAVLAESQVCSAVRCLTRWKLTELGMRKGRKSGQLDSV